MLLIHWINFYHRTFKNKAIGKELPHPGAPGHPYRERANMHWIIHHQDTQHNGTQPNNIHHDDNQHKGLVCDTEHYNALHYAGCHYVYVAFNLLLCCVELY